MTATMIMSLLLNRHPNLLSLVQSVQVTAGKLWRCSLLRALVSELATKSTHYSSSRSASSSAHFLPRIQCIPILITGLITRSSALRPLRHSGPQIPGNCQVPGQLECSGSNTRVLEISLHPAHVLCTTQDGVYTHLCVCPSIQA